MEKTYELLRDEQYKLLGENPYTEVDWFVYDSDKDCIINVMSFADEGKEYNDLEELTVLLNKYRNDIQHRKTTMGRMRRDIRVLTSKK